MILVPGSIFAVDVNFDASVADNTKPSVAITSHTNGTTYTSTTLPLTIKGTANDNVTGIGLNANSTKLTLRRSSDGKYWNGATWVAGATYLATTHPATTTNGIANWTVSSPLPTLSPNTYTLVARATDKSGNTKDTAPVVFTVVSSTSISPPVITAPTEGSITDDNTPTVTGTGVPGLTVTVTVVSTGETYTTVVQPDGTWSLVVTTTLPDGVYDFTATQTDGVTTSAPDTLNFTIGVPPPVITSPTEGDVVPDSTPLVTGTGIAGAIIAVTVLETGDTYTTTVNPDGTWSLTITNPLAQGNYTLDATQTVSGVTSSLTGVDFTVGVPPPVITSPTEGEALKDSTPKINGTGIPGAEVTVTILETGDTYTTTVKANGKWSLAVTNPLADGEYNIRATQTIGDLISGFDSVLFTVGIPAPVIIYPANGELVTDTTPTITGTGIPGATISLEVLETGDKYTTIVDEDGNWSIEITEPLPIDSYIIEVTQKIDGLTSPSATRNFFIVYVTPITGFITNAPGVSGLNTALALIAGFGTLIISALPVIFALPAGLPVIPQLSNFFAFFLAWVERRRRYGIVYDSVTREGIEGVSVRLIAGQGTKFETGKLIETKKTDEEGRYVFNVSEGVYRIEVVRADYRFPANRTEEGYKGETSETNEGLYYHDTPMDNLTPNAHKKAVNFKTLGHRVNQTRIPILVAGTRLALFFVIERAHIIDWIIITLYGLIWATEVYKLRSSRNVSFVFTKSGPAPLAILRLLDEQGRLLKTRVSNLSGQYSIFAPSGKYALDTAKEGFQEKIQKIKMRQPGIVPKRVKLDPIPPLPSNN